MTRIPAAFLALTLLASPAATFASAYEPSTAGVSLEVVMQENGRVNVKGARVRSVRADGFTAEAVWGSSKLVWKIETDEDTSIVQKNGKGIVLAQVTAGDYVSFTGNIQTNRAPFTITADSVRNWSLSAGSVVYSGIVEAVDPDARTLTLVTSKGGTITVRTDEDTAFAQSGARVFTDIQEGDSVLAFGQGKGDTITARKVNLTERASVTADTAPRIATGLGSWVDDFLPRFFVGRMN